jgi:shikimate kinase
MMPVSGGLRSSSAALMASSAALIRSSPGEAL